MAGSTHQALTMGTRTERERGGAGWPRLLDLQGLAEYLNIGRWTAEELVRGGLIPLVRIPRPRTARALKHRPAGETLRRLLVDRTDVDRFVDEECRKERL